jgi:hypothetical protein
MGRPKKLFPVFRVVGANIPVCKKIPKRKKHGFISIKKASFFKEGHTTTKGYHIGKQ